jgi:hypothetical protein
MSKFHLGLIIGIFIGTWIGLFIFALLNIAKRADRDVERLLAKKSDEDAKPYQDRFGYDSEEERERTEKLTRNGY